MVRKMFRPVTYIVFLVAKEPMTPFEAQHTGNVNHGVRMFSVWPQGEWKIGSKKTNNEMRPQTVVRNI